MLYFFSNFRLKEWLLILLSICLIVGQVFCDLRLPEYMEAISVKVADNTITMENVLENGGYMLLCALMSGVLTVGTGFCVSHIAASFAHRLRSRIFDKVNSFSLSEINKFSTASLITRSTNDITHVSFIIAMGLEVLIKAPIMSVWAICKIVGKAWQWTLATGVSVAILMLVILVLFLLTFRNFKVIQQKVDKINNIARENLRGIRSVRAYNAGNYQCDKFDKTNNELFTLNFKTNATLNFLSPTINLVLNGLSLSVYIIGAIIIDMAIGADRILLFGDMVVITSYALQVVMSFMMLVLIFIFLPSAVASWQRIKEVLMTPLTIKDGKGEIGSKGGKIELRNVSFKYPNAEEYVLKNISFSANCGETVAFIGSTGSGKSTLINLIPRFYDATEGEVLVDGINVKDMALADLHNKIGYVPQKAVLFSGTVKSNVAYGSKGDFVPSQKDIERAVKISQSEEFVKKMKDSYNATIEQSGSNISGGQKQRLSIARAIARKPEIYIFDDSFSALDFATDKNVRTEFKKHVKDATILMVSQRIGTIKNADKIIVLENGEIVGMGTHGELLKSCPIYKEIALLQLSEEELKNA